MGDPIIIPQKLPYILEMEREPIIGANVVDQKPSHFVMGPTREPSIRRWKLN